MFETLTHLQAFELCCVKGLNLSYQCLTSFEAREKLRNLKTTDPEFHSELVKGKAKAGVAEDEKAPEDEEEDVENEDDSGLPCEVVIRQTLNKKLPSKVVHGADGQLMSSAVAESLDAADEDDSRTRALAQANEEEDLGVGKRKRRPNKLYYTNFWRHCDNDDSEDESYL
jgi:hypothetical protein